SPQDAGPAERELRRAAELLRRERLRRGAELVDAERERAARAAMLEIMRSPPSAARRGRRAWLSASLAAAAALLVVAVSELGGGTPRPGSGAPGPPGGVARREPIGPVSAFAVFAWDGELLPGTHFVLTIRDADSGKEFLHERVDGRRWSPADERKLPR